MSKKIFATFIGINAYAQSPLSGCIKDVLNMDLFLREHAAQQDGVVYNPSYFLAPDAVDKKWIEEYKTAIKATEFNYEPATFKMVTTKAFAHLKKAENEDICFLYYSGHGSQTDEPEVFWHTKPDRQNETIVCVDSRDPKNPESRDIIDKELAYLLWDALNGKKVHCVVIMDCCHSGNNTREAVDNKKAAVRFRYTPSSKNKIPFESYLGYAEGFYKIYDGKASIQFANYIHLAACRDSEKAQESNEGGLFSSKLMEALRSGGTAKSYRELVQSLAITIRNRNSQQNPVAYAKDDAELDLQFLGEGIKAYQPSFEVRYDFKKEKWIMYGGAIHNIAPSSGQSKTLVKINGLTAIVKVNEVSATTAILDDDDMGTFDKENEEYQAVIVRMANSLINIGLSSLLYSNKTLLSNLKDAYNQTTKLFYTIDFNQKIENANYQIQLTDDNAYILTKMESEVILFQRETIPINFLNNVDSVCKWLSVSELKNTNSKISKDDFIFTLEKIEGKAFTPATIDSVKGQKKEIKPGQEFVFSYVGQIQPAFRLSIQLKNSAVQPFYLGALYMDSRFGIKTDFIKWDNNTLLKKDDFLNLSYINGATVFKTTPLKIENIYTAYNINEVTEFLKIFVSNEPLNLDRYKQPSLELDRQFRQIRNRGAGFADDNADEETDWTVFSFPFRIQGPNKEQKLEPGRVTDFSSFKIEVPNNFSANAFAATGNDLQRKINTVSRGINQKDDEESDKQFQYRGDPELIQFIAPPQSIWGDVVSDADVFSNGLSAASDNGVKVLELYPGQAGDKVEIREGEEIIIYPNQQKSRALKDNDWEETIVPYGYDQLSKLYIPLGFTDNSGNIHISQLPSLTPGIIWGEEQLTRSVGSSVKLFFKKIFNRGKANTLTLYQVLPGQLWIKITEDPDEMKTIFEKNNTSSIVLLIHGIFGSTKEMVGSLMEANNFSFVANFVLAYDYENLSNSITTTAKALKEDLFRAGFGKGNKCTLSIVAHSMGGLVARRLVEAEGASTYVTHVILAGTPNAGSELAQLKLTVFGLMAHAMNVTGPIKYALTALSFLMKKLNADPGETLTEMSPKSSFLTDLSISAPPPGIKYSLLGGNTFLLENGYNGDDYFLKKIAEALKLKLVYPGLSAVLFKDKPNDMAVTLDSMQDIAGFNAGQMHIVANDHISYFSEKASQEKLIGLLNHSGGNKTSWFVKNEENILSGLINKVYTNHNKERGFEHLLEFGQIDIHKASTTDDAENIEKKESFFVNAHYKNEASLDEEIFIKVNLTKKAAETAGIPILATINSWIYITIESKKGFIVVGKDVNKIQVSDQEEGSYINFILKATTLGEGKIRVMAFGEGTELGHLDIIINISKSRQAGASAKATSGITFTSTPRPDLTLMISENINNGKSFLSFKITAQNPALKLYLAPFGPVELKLDPRKYVQEFFDDIESLPSDTKLADILDKLEKKGMQLFEDLIPAELKKIIWSVRKDMKTLKIDSDEPWIPWEICRLTGEENGKFEEGLFFCEAFEITRWIPGHGAPRTEISLNKIAIVVPEDSRLEYAKKEKDDLINMVKNNFTITTVPAKYYDLKEAFSDGNFSAWHFSGHGSFIDTANPEKSKIILEAGETIDPQIINGRVKNLGQSSPLIFFNACQIGKGAMGLTGINSWASKFLDAGASSFIGAYWSISDSLAYDFAIKFYQELLQGNNIGKAVKEARMSIKKPGDPTWLAYTVFADPFATLMK